MTEATTTLTCADLLRAIIEGDNRSIRLDWRTEDERCSLDFVFNGVPRTIHWVHSDNTCFLDEDAELAFYFHRGDSWGEAGAGQKWDSELLPELLAKIPTGKKCLYLTDGEPGGFAAEHSQEKFDLAVQNRNYFCGRFVGP